jgi:hypothetical protein
MTLDDSLREIFKERKGGILVVDDRCDVNARHDEVYYEHISNEERIESLAYRHGFKGFSFVRDMAHSVVGSDDLRYKNCVWNPPGLILVNAEGDGPVQNILDITKSIETIRRLEQDFPDADIIQFNPTYKANVNAALDKVRSVLGSGTHATVRFDPGLHPTLMHLLCEAITGSFTGNGLSKERLSARQHDYSHKLWGEYIPYISESLRAGNGQTSLAYSYLIISDRECNQLGNFDINGRGEKVKVESAKYNLSEDDLSSCAAIFIDNAWNSLNHEGALGDGVEVLRTLRARLDEAGVRIPIIYQSGHNSDAFTDDEREVISDLGAVLATKDIFPKVCVGRAIAEKEIEVSRLVRSNSQLAKYTSEVVEFAGESLARDDLFVVCSRIQTGDTVVDEEKVSYLNALGLDSTPVTHRMYVLANFHSQLQDQLDNPLLQATSKDFIDFDDLKGGIMEAQSLEYGLRLEDFRDAYVAIVEKHREYTPSVISHNDAKWDNWFNGEVLGDFGSVQPGNEYKDIAKALLEKGDGFALAKDEEKVEQAIANYVVLRQSVDSDFVAGEYFVENVKDMLVTECLRTAHYKAEDTGLVKDMLDIVKWYI